MPPSAEIKGAAPKPNDAVETVLIVDDEEPVRKTFREWLEGAGLPCRILSAADAEAALVQANQQTIDLAILDWNLGAGNDGLQLLEDLYLFNPDVVAIMVTGYANQATPLHAMRMGVRDYLDKNHDLNRETFLHAVKRQLDQIRPAKRARRLNQTLLAFREAVEKILPLVQSAAAFSAEDKRVAQSAANLGTDLLRQALGQRQTQQILLDAVAAALGAGNQMAETLSGTSSQRLEEPPPAQVLQQLQEGLSAGLGD